MIRLIVEYGFFLALLAFGLALAVSPAYSTVRGWHARPTRENLLRILGAALGLYVGVLFMLRAVELCFRF